MQYTIKLKIEIDDFLKRSQAQACATNSTS